MLCAHRCVPLLLAHTETSIVVAFVRLSVLVYIPRLCCLAHSPLLSCAAGLLDGLFMKMYEEDIIEEEAFWAWKDDSSHEHITGKQKALVNSVRFFNWLQEAAAADESEAEDSEVEEALKDIVRPNNSAKLR